MGRDTCDVALIVVATTALHAVYKQAYLGSMAIAIRLDSENLRMRVSNLCMRVSNLRMGVLLWRHVILINYLLDRGDKKVKVRRYTYYYIVLQPLPTSYMCVVLGSTGMLRFRFRGSLARSSAVVEQTFFQELCGKGHQYVDMTCIGASVEHMVDTLCSGCARV